jgi:hypothetical protein
MPHRRSPADVDADGSHRDRITNFSAWTKK